MSKLVFDGVELPRVHRISALQTRSGGGEDGNGADENMGIENGSNNSATRSFYISSGAHNMGTKIPAESNATRGRRITKQRKGVRGNIPASDFQTSSEQPFAHESSLSGGTSPLTYYQWVTVCSDPMLILVLVFRVPHA
jgi:hypothetical protein